MSVRGVRDNEDEGEREIKKEERPHHHTENELIILLRRGVTQSIFNGYGPFLFH